MYQIRAKEHGVGGIRCGTEARRRSYIRLRFESKIHSFSTVGNGLFLFLMFVNVRKLRPLGKRPIFKCRHFIKRFVVRLVIADTLRLDVKLAREAFNVVRTTGSYISSYYGGRAVSRHSSDSGSYNTTAGVATPSSGPVSSNGASLFMSEKKSRMRLAFELRCRGANDINVRCVE